MIIVKHDRTIESHCLKCPYCGNEDQDAWETLDKDDDKYEIECESCGKKFWGEKCVMIDYRGEADCELNGEEHDLEPTKNKGQQECKTCGQYVHDMDKIQEDTEKE